MSDSGGVTLDSVIINIETQAGRSTSNIDKLTTSLGNLKAAIKGGFNNINKLSQGLMKLNTASNKISKIRENVQPMGDIARKMRMLANIESPKGVRFAARALEELAIASEKVAKTGQNLYAVDKLVYPLAELSSIQSATGLGYTVRQLEKMSQVAPNIGVIVAQASRIPRLVEPLQALTNISTPRGFGSVVKHLTSLQNILSKITPETIAQLTAVCNELSKSLEPLAQRLNSISSGFVALQSMANKYGASIDGAGNETRQTRNYLTHMRFESNRLVKSFGKLIKVTNQLGKVLKRRFEGTSSIIRQVTLSLIGTRTAFTAVRKAVSEYMQLDEQLQKQTTNLWRAMGAQLAPAIEYVIYLFTQVTRVIYSVIYALTGIDLIARANAKALALMSKSAADALGNLQKFDDLNVVEFNKDDGKDKLIDLDKIDLSPIQKVIDWMKKLKQSIIDAWNSGQWYEVGKVLVEGINGAMNWVDFTVIQNKLDEIAEDFGDLLQGYFDNFDGSKFGEQLTNVLKFKWDVLSTFLNEMPWDTIGERLAEAIKTFKPADIINAIGNVFYALVSGLVTIISKQSAEEIGKRLVEGLGAFFKNIGKLFTAIPWYELGVGIRNALAQIKWADVLSGLWKAISTFAIKVADLVGGIFGTAKDATGGLIPVIFVGLPLFIYGMKNLIKTFSAGEKATKSFTKGFKQMGNALSTIALLGGIALVINQIVNLLKVFADTGMSVTDAVGLLVTVFLGISVAVMAMAAAFSLIDWNGIAAGVVILGMLSVVILSLTNMILAFGIAGVEVADVTNLLLTLFGGIVVLMGAVALIGPAMSAGLLPFSVLMLEIAGILAVLALTIPPILDACGKFIDKIAPPIIKILEILSELIVDIIYALGDVLPPIIREVGTIFGTVFKGIEIIVRAVGDVIVRIMTAAGNVVDNLLKSILHFIRELGPAINTFVDNTIIAITKLVNFIVSAVEFFINGIVTGLNGLSSGLRKVGNKIFEIIGVDVTFEPINKVSLDRFAPKLETGTNEVPYEGLYHLHQGEAVVPKKYNPALGNGTDEELGQKLDTLISIMGNMNFTNVVNIGNKTLYKEQQRYNKMQNDKYGTTVSL